MSSTGRVMVAITAVLLGPAVWATEPETGVEPALIYSYDEMLHFDLKQYLHDHAPHLEDQSEVLSHWAGYSSISPKVLLALIELQSSGVSNASRYAQQQPFGPLSAPAPFAEQVQEVATRLASTYYRDRELKRQAPDSRALLELLPNTISATNFTATYRRLFPQDTLPRATRLTAAALPPADLLQLPFPAGEAWYFGGSHTNTGSGTFPQASLDLNNGGGWGSDTRNKWVVAAAEGRAVRHSSCSVEVIHPGGWSTTYYHLDNVQIQTNQQVVKNQRLANYAGNRNQALCNGGHSTGPHQHFSLKREGSFHHLNDVLLSGYKVHTGRDSYDSDCSYFWLLRAGQKFCVGNRLPNPGTGLPEPLLLNNGQALSNLAASQGTFTYYRLQVPADATELYFSIAGGSGDADMHVLRGEQPNLSRYDCRPYSTSQDESCRYAAPVAGTWYVLLHAFGNYQGIRLQAGYRTARRTQDLTFDSSGQ
ncbi:MAG: pre-peptidase C-terminal domain-containing protein [Pseudomonas sp.]|uniref:pre-peptidase C-terminal domain-containing protein n=1 Tax=Pseudomonas sp. TaxID=306 RepID=UPI0033936960